MSGEQAEERTAREGRARELCRQASGKLMDAKLPSNDDLAEAVFAKICYHVIAEPLLSECSRLASRVEELEEALRMLIRESEYNRTGGILSGERIQEQLEWWRKFAADSLLAGAHAEEKGK